MPSDKSMEIISLNYHEVSEDPRVLKQARALTAAGYKVHVYCDWPEGKLQHEIIDGIRITRFKCFGNEGASTAAFSDMTFLSSARQTIAERYLPYAGAREVLARGKAASSSGHSGFFDRMQSRYYKQHKGLKRLRRKMVYLALNASFRLGLFRLPPEISETRRSLKAAFQDLKKYRKGLFQVMSVLYWSNIRDQAFDGAPLAIHAHDLYCLPAGVMLAKRFGVPLVYDAHEYEPARATKMDPSLADLPAQIEDDCFPHVRNLITVSGSIAELYATRFRGPAPVVVMNSPEMRGVTGVAVAGNISIRDMIGLDASAPLVVFTGGIQRAHRGMDRVLEAIAQLPGYHLANLGFRREHDDAWFLKIARELGVSERVHLLDPVDARDVPAAIRSATLSVCPIQDVSLSYRYSLPNKLFEAACAGIPICVSDLPDMRQFVERLGIGIAMNQTDPLSIASAMKHIVANRENYVLTEEALAILQREYSWEAQTKKLVAIYRDILPVGAV